MRSHALAAICHTRHFASCVSIQPSCPVEAISATCRRLPGLTLLTETEPHVADGAAAETLFKARENFCLCDLLQFVVHGRLQNAHVKHAIAQCGGRGMGSDE